MLIRMPDGSWLDPRAVKAMYPNVDRNAVFVHVGLAEEIPFYPADCWENEGDPEPTLEELSDTIATLINNELGRRI